MFAMMAWSAPARADGAAFLRTFDTTKDQSRVFPKNFPFFNMKDAPTTLKFGDGEPWRLINFWAAWCGPCIQEMPSLKALQADAARKKSFEVVMVSADMLPSAAALRYMMNQKNLPPLDSALYIKDFNAWEGLGINSLPTTMIVSPRGEVVFTMVGAGDWRSADARAFLQMKLPKGVAP